MLFDVDPNRRFDIFWNCDIHNFTAFIAAMSHDNEITLLKYSPNSMTVLHFNVTSVP